MLKIEKMKYMDLNISSIETFKSLCELIGNAYANAKDYITVKGNSIYQLTEPPIFSNKLYGLQKESLKHLCQKLQQPLYSIRITCNERMDEAEEEKMLASISQVAAPLLPSTSTLFSGDRKEKTLLILMPASSKENCETISQKILEATLKNNRLNKETFKLNIEMIFDPQSQGEPSKHD